MLVTFVLFIFMLSVRASLIVAIAIPLSLAASFVYLSVRGMSANLLSMGAVDFGIIVDGAVILVEHLFHRLSLPEGSPSRQGPDPHRRPRAAHLHRRARGRPTDAVLALDHHRRLPADLLAPAGRGRIFSPLANTVVSALVGALLVSFTVVPVLSFYALRRPKAHRESPVLRLAKRFYDPLLDLSMRHSAVVLVLALGALVSAVTLLPRLGSGSSPSSTRARST